MVGGPQAMEAPQGPGQRTVAERLALAPPVVPEAPQIIVRAGLLAREFVGQQAADAKQPRLQSDGADFGLGRANSRAQFGQALHRPDVVFVAQRPQPAFPKGLLPTSLAGARLQLDSLSTQPDQG